MPLLHVQRAPALPLPPCCASCACVPVDLALFGMLTFEPAPPWRCRRRDVIWSLATAWLTCGAAGRAAAYGFVA